MSASETVRALRRSDFSVPELVEAHLEQIRRVDPQLHAFVGLREEQARAEARAAQRAFEAQAPVGPLHGVPFTAKDILASSDPTPRCGSRAVPESTEPNGIGLAFEATAITRVRAAGGIFLGKTACPEYAFGVDCNSPGRDFTGNPWGVGLTPGGSSGGESAALSGHMSTLGIGTDFGGSLRWPAACVGIVALRPTVGRIPGTGQLPGLPIPTGQRVPNPMTVQGALQVIGPMARTVQDLILALDVMSGPDGYDLSAGVRGDLRYSESPGLRVGWLTAEDSTPVRDDVRATVQTVVEHLARAGCQPVSCEGLLDGAHLAYNALRDADGFDDLQAFISGNEHMLGTSLRALLRDTSPADPIRLARAWADTVPIRRRVLAALGVIGQDRAVAPAIDVFVCPVAPVPAFRRDEPTIVAGRTLVGFELMSLCRAVTVLGLPALSVPCGLSDEGLPINVQVVGRPFSEDTVLRVGTLIEAVCGTYSAAGMAA